MKIRILLWLASSMVLALGSGPERVSAQEQAAGAGAGQTGQALQEVVVTAERRKENLQDVPISATVLSGKDLKDRGVTDLNDIANVAPSVTVNTYNRQSFVNIRGVGESISAPTTSSGVAYYIDDVLVPDDQFIGFSFYDIDAIEVLRGPQGTLSGQNSTGGAVYIRTPTPQFNHLGGYADLAGGDYDQYRAVGALDAGGENIALRVAATHDQRNSFTSNIGPSPSQPGKYNFNGARGSLRFRNPADDLTVTLRGEFFDNRSGGQATKNRFDAVTADPFVIEQDAVSYTRQKGFRVSAEVRYDLTRSMELRGLASRQHGETLDQRDSDVTATALPVPLGLPATPANTKLYPGRVQYTSTVFDPTIAEVDLLSRGQGPVQWVFGGFYLSGGTHLDSYLDNYHTTNVELSDSTIETQAQQDSRSLFGQVSVYVTHRIELVAGGRNNWDKMIYQRLAVRNALIPPSVGIAKSSEFTGKAAVNYHLDRALIYLSASKGYKAGGANLVPGSPNFGPETNVVYELGAKTQLLNNHLRLDGDIFDASNRGIQVSTQLNHLPLFQNAARAKSRGAELEALGRFGPAQFNVGLGYLDAEFARDACLVDGNSAITSPACAAGNRMVPEGAVLPYSPKWTVNAGIQYSILASDNIVVVPRVQWSYLDRELATPFPSIYTFMPAHSVFDASVIFQLPHAIQLRAFVDNFTNDIYVATQIQDSSGATGGYIYGAPRTFGAELRIGFGGG